MPWDAPDVDRGRCGRGSMDGWSRSFLGRRVERDMACIGQAGAPSRGRRLAGPRRQQQRQQRRTGCGAGLLAPHDRVAGRGNVRSMRRHVRVEVYRSRAGAVKAVRTPCYRACRGGIADPRFSNERGHPRVSAAASSSRTEQRHRAATPGNRIEQLRRAVTAARGPAEWFGGRTAERTGHRHARSPRRPSSRRTGAIAGPESRLAASAHETGVRTPVH